MKTSKFIKLLTGVLLLSSITTTVVAQKHSDGVVGDGGSVVTDRNGNTYLADLFLEHEGKRLPSYYKEFDFNDHPGLLEEYKNIQSFISRRIITEGHVLVNLAGRLRIGINQLNLSLKRFEIYNTARLSGSDDHAKENSRSVKQAAYTYITNVYDDLVLENVSKRIIEIKKDVFDQLETNREKALLILHEVLHHVEPVVYARLLDERNEVDPHLLISPFIKSLAVLLKVEEEQAQEMRELTKDELKESIRFQNGIDQLRTHKVKNIFFSRFGGVSNVETYALDNKIGVGSSLLHRMSWRDYDDVGYNHNYAKNGYSKNMIKGSRIIVSTSKSAECRNNTFSEVSLDRFGCFSSKSYFKNTVTSGYVVSIKNGQVEDSEFLASKSNERFNLSGSNLTISSTKIEDSDINCKGRSSITRSNIRKSFVLFKQQCNISNLDLKKSEVRASLASSIDSAEIYSSNLSCKKCEMKEVNFDRFTFRESRLSVQEGESYSALLRNIKAVNVEMFSHATLLEDLNLNGTKKKVAFSIQEPIVLKHLNLETEEFSNYKWNLMDNILIFKGLVDYIFDEAKVYSNLKKIRKNKFNSIAQFEERMMAKQ